MNVLIVCTEKLPVPPVKGGAIQTYIYGTIPNLSKKHSITIIGRNDETLPDDETKDGVRYVRVPGGLLETYREGVVDFVKKNDFDVIHIFNRPRLVLPIREAAPDARLVLSMHNDMFKREKINPEEAQEAIQQLDKIITISNYIGEEIVRLYPDAGPKIKTIYSGVDLEQFVPSYSDKGKRIRAAIRQKHNLESKKVILFAGRLSPNKGADMLLRAMGDLVKKHSDVALVLMGGKGFSDNRMTDYIAYIKAVADRLSIPVITTGFVQPDQIQDWFAAADIFVCPSQWEEPLARVHYEAMAAGLPIVTTKRGGNPEVIEVGKNGYIVEKPDDPREFAEHLSKLLSSPSLCRSMGQYGRSIAEKNHTWSRVIDDIDQVWTEVEHKMNENIAIGSSTIMNDELSAEIESSISVPGYLESGKTQNENTNYQITESEETHTEETHTEEKHTEETQRERVFPFHRWPNRQRREQPDPDLFAEWFFGKRRSN